MLQFDKHQIIPLDIRQPKQIESALTQYRNLLNSGDAFRNELFDIEFIHQTEQETRRLQPSDAGENLTLLVKALSMGQDGGSLPTDIEQEDEIYLSEAILFAAALQYPEIRPAVVDAAQAIVAYCRRENDTSCMWLDDMRVFGIEALYMLAKTDLQYAYLVSQFFIPYWDDEHATQYEEYLADLLTSHGWCPEMIKAFIWCDNTEFRFCMFMHDVYTSDLAYQPLGEYLQQNPNQYADFKQQVIARFKSEPVLLSTNHIDEDEDEDVEAELAKHHPVVWLYTTLFAYTEDDDDGKAQDKLMQQPFMDSTLEQQAYDLEQEIRTQVTGALVKYSLSAFVSRDRYTEYSTTRERRYELNFGIDLLKPLILAMPQGARLWRYVENGSEIDALEAIEEIQLLPFAKQHSLQMSLYMESKLHEWQTNNAGIAEQLHDVLELVRCDLLVNCCDDEDNDIEQATLPVSLAPGQSLYQARGQQYLRVVDVFYHVLGKHELGKYMMESVTESREEPLISHQDYYRRYSQSGENGAKQKEMQAIFDIFTENDELLFNRHFARVNSGLRASRELCHPKHWQEPNMGFFALASYQLYMDTEQNIADEVTTALEDYLNQNNIWQQAAEKILNKCAVQGSTPIPKETDLTEQDIALVYDYFTSKHSEQDQTSLIALLTPALDRNDWCRGDIYLSKYSEYQPSYGFLDDHYDDFQRFTLTAFWLRQLSLPDSELAERLWQFLVAIAPVRTARNILRAYSDNPYSVEFEESEHVTTLKQQLIDAGIDSGVLGAYEMSHYIHTTHTDEYAQWLDDYSAITYSKYNPFSRAKRKQALALDQGLKLISENQRIDFLHHAALKYPEINLDIMHDVKRALRLVIELNICSWEYALAHEFKDVCLYIGETERVDKKLKRPLVINELTVSDKPCHIDNMTWLNVTLVQEIDDHYHVLMADSDYVGNLKTRIVESEQNTLDANDLWLGRGHILILNGTADRQVLIERAIALQDLNARIEYVFEQTLAYLDGNVDYASIASLYAMNLRTHNFIPSTEEYRHYSLSQFIWMLGNEKRDRLVKLLLNHDYRGFKVLEGEHEKAWRLHQLKRKAIDFNQYLKQESNDEIAEQGMSFLLNWLISLEINPAHITLFCIKRTKFSACCEFIHLHARGDYGDFTQTLRYLKAQNRAKLPEILSLADDNEILMQTLSNDKSSAVKNAVETWSH